VEARTAGETEDQGASRTGGYALAVRTLKNFSMDRFRGSFQDIPILRPISMEDGRWKMEGTSTSLI
jgi:hypothetical protein